MWNEACPNGELKLELHDGLELVGEMPMVESETEAEYTSWLEDGYNAVRYEGEIYMKISDLGGDLEVVTIDQANDRLKASAA